MGHKDTLAGLRYHQKNAERDAVRLHSDQTRALYLEKAEAFRRRADAIETKMKTTAKD